MTQQPKIETAHKPEPCKPIDIGMNYHTDTPLIVRQTLENYFKDFAAPMKRNGRYICLKCDRQLDGPLGTLVGHGSPAEMRCGNCGWPARIHHLLFDHKGQKVGELHNVLLQYHMTNVSYTGGPIVVIS